MSKEGELREGGRCQLLFNFYLVRGIEDNFRSALIGGYKAGDFNIFSRVLLRVRKFGNAGIENYGTERTSFIIRTEIYKYSSLVRSINVVNFACYANNFSNIFRCLCKIYTL